MNWTKVRLWLIWEAAMTNPKNFEPSADARIMAKQLFNTFMAMKLEGFTEDQALSIISMCIYAMYQAES